MHVPNGDLNLQLFSLSPGSNPSLLVSGSLANYNVLIKVLGGTIKLSTFNGGEHVIQSGAEFAWDGPADTGATFRALNENQGNVTLAVASVRSHAE